MGRITVPIAASLFALTMGLPLLPGADPWTILENARSLPPAERRTALQALLLERPGFLPAHYNLGTELIATDTAAAMRHLTIAATDPDPRQAADAFHNLALAKWQAGHVEEAVVAMGEAAQRQPEFISARDELRRGALARLDQARRDAEAAAKALRIPQQQLPDCFVGEPASASVKATGGAGGYMFAPDGPLPEGIQLDPSGRLLGIPNKPGPVPLRLVVRDKDGATASGTVALIVNPAPSIVTKVLPLGVVNQPYEASVKAIGLQKPRWSGVDLPAGLRLDAVTGAISGTPTVAGSATVTVRAEDGKRQATGKVRLDIDPLFTPDVANIPGATAWTAYRHKIGVRGPAGAYQFSATATGGLSISKDGTISGTPDQAGQITFLLTISAPSSSAALATGSERRSGQIGVTVNPPPVINEPEPIALPQGKATNRPLQHRGGTPPLSFRISEGQLPAGLRLDNDGTLRGSPQQEGQETKLRIEMTDRWKATTHQEITIRIQAPETKPEQQPQDKQEEQKEQPQDKEKENKEEQEKTENSEQQSDNKHQQPQPEPAGESATQAAERMREAAAEAFLDQAAGQGNDQDALRKFLLGGAKPDGGSGPTW